MKIEYSQCNQCGRAVQDPYMEIGWLQIRGIESFTISVGRAADRHAITRYGGPPSGSITTMDFCGTGCLITYLEALKESP